MILDGAALDLALHGANDGPRAYLARFGYDSPPLHEVDDQVAPIDAEINGGHWIWICPCTRGSETDPPIGGGVAFVDCPYGYCVRCQNAETEGRWRRLRFPDERELIEAVLMLRPDPTTRHWWPGETVEGLVKENAEHGIGVAL